jgi:glycosyltransferase involved in cell wall biosynthesis
MKIAFVTNLPSHYHTRLFETIAKHYDTDFLFFSDGSETWIEKMNELKFGNYKGIYVRGIHLTSRVRINTELVSRLVRGKYEVIIQAISGRFELPATFFIAKILRKPFILWTNLWFHPNTFFHKLSFQIMKYIYRHADAIVAYGYHVRDYLVSLGVDENKIFYSWNVTDNDLFNKPVPDEALEKLKTEYKLHGRRIILFVGRLSDEKGLIYLLQAYKQVPVELNASLLLVGEGKQRDALAQYVEDNNFEHVHFIGYVPYEELAAYYTLADVFVLPSVTTKTLKEVWGIVLNEAMNRGCPVIATTAVGAAVGGLVQEGKNGVVVAERDPKALRDAILQILSDERKLQEMRNFTENAIKAWDTNKSFKGFQEAIGYITKRVR